MSLALRLCVFVRGGEQLDLLRATGMDELVVVPANSAAAVSSVFEGLVMNEKTGMGGKQQLETTIDLLSSGSDESAGTRLFFWTQNIATYPACC